MPAVQSKICRAIAKHSRRPCRAWAVKEKEYCRDHQEKWESLLPVDDDSDEKRFLSLKESTVVLVKDDSVIEANPGYKQVMGYGEWMWSFFPKLW